MSLIKTAVALIAILMGVEFHSTATFPCKYSVRDVAFVNIHREPWQLQLLKPTTATASQIEQWNQTVQQALDRSNIDYTWVESQSPQGQLISQRATDSKQEPGSGIVAQLSRSSGDAEILGAWEPANLAREIGRLVDSPLRQQMLSDLSQCLCVILLIESGNDELDLPAKAAVQRAVSSINRQMWSYEKAPDQGPVMHELTRANREQEYWLIKSAGLEPADLDQPLVAIVYGQGVILGEPLMGNDQLEPQLVARAGICGRSCECDLDKKWLYGQQVLHRWTLANERMAETSLDFDPNSSLVQAEVSQIIQKSQAGGNTVGTEPTANLGGGLIIHELDDLAASPPSLETQPRAASPATESETSDPVAKRQPLVPSTESLSENTIPWFLMGGIALILLVFMAVFWHRFKPGSGASRL